MEESRENPAAEWSRQLMQQLGYTRSSHQPDHLLLTADTFVRAPLPGLENAAAIVHVSPAVGAAFTQYTVEFEAGGSMAAGACQRFVYVLEGKVTLASRTLGPDQYAYLPPGCPEPIAATTPARAAVIEKAYLPLAGVAAPSLLSGDERAVPGTPLAGDADLEVRTLLPAGPAFDFAVNTMTYQPGAALSMVEIHVMEHGLLMLEGSGIYRLGHARPAPPAGDFIWMAAYCPQW